jgi:membrane protein YdbS with pleckstrin-like domain
MHRFPNKSVVTRFKVAAFLLCMKCLMAPAVAGMLTYSVITDDLNLTKISVALVILTVLIAMLQWLLAARTRCPLCMTPVLAATGCSKHRSARKFMGSHRLRVAVAILFKDSFLCPYCHEPSAMEVRTRGRQPKAPRY